MESRSWHISPLHGQTAPLKKGFFSHAKRAEFFSLGVQTPLLLSTPHPRSFEGAFAANFKRLFLACQRNFAVRQKHFAMKSPEEKVRISGRPLAGKFAG